MKKNALCVTGCFVLWGILPIYWKLLSKLDSMFILSNRMVWSLVFCMFIVLFSGNYPKIKEAIQDKKQFMITACCGVLITINWGSYIYAVNAGHILDASLAYYMNPLLSIAIAFAAFREKLSVQKWAAAGIAFLGILYTIIEYGTFPWLSLVIGGSFAVYGALKKNVKYEAMVSLFIETMVITPFALIYIIYCEVHGTGSEGILTGAEFLLLPLAGVITAIPLLLYASGVKGIPYSLSGILMYLNPTLQLLIGVFLYKETFTGSSAVMFACVWAALVLFLLDGKIFNKITSLQRKKKVEGGKV